MSSSQIFPAITGLISIATAVMPAVQVHDGTFNTEDINQDFLLVGADSAQAGLLSGPATGSTTAVDGSSEWASLGAQHRDEFFTIWNTYVAWNGDGDLAACRTRSHTNIGLLEAELRNPTGTSFSLGGALGIPGWCAVQITRVNYVSTAGMSYVETLFGVVCRGRI